MASIADTIGSKKQAQVILLQMILVGTILCGNVLIWPPEGSHWLNVKVIIQELIARDHNVTVVVSSASPYVRFNSTASRINYDIFQVPVEKDYVNTLIEDMMKIWMYEKQHLNTWKFYKRFSQVVVGLNRYNRYLCDGVMKNKEVMERLHSNRFDVVLSDPVFICGDLLALKLGVPFVYSLRYTPGSTVERHCGKIPSPPSYVPATLSEFSDIMSLSERLENFVSYIVQDYAFHSIWGEWDSYYSNVLGRPTTFCETMGKAEIWLIRTYWDFEYPRPLLPNFEYVGGLHCKPAKPLPEEMETFVQSSGEHGIVVFSLGSMVKNLTDEKSNMIAAALSQIPQKVLWRYSGNKPDTLGPNTMIYDWIPQNDLLGHPKAKAFISHGGTNGIYEAIYHGIPMIGIPLFADQPDNMAHMKSKGMAVVLDFNTMESQDLVDAVNTVIGNSTYKENALRLSQIHHDQPMKPLDRAVFWIEFVMRHKGAKHLRPAAHLLTWYQYHCLDVIAFLFVCLLSILFAIIKCFTFFWRKCGRIQKKKND